MLGQLIGDRYEIIEILGSGNMANTYLTEDLGRDRQRCVVKRLNSSHPDPKMLEAKKQLFAREAASLHALGKHSQIPQRLAYVENSEDCYLVQEFVDGYPLMEGIIPGEQWTSFQVVQFLEEMLSLLAFVHSQGFIHRDIKPSNIMRRHSDNRLVLIDFGAATQILVRQSPFTRTRANFVVGTPGYMPIEQANGRARPNSDVYSLGMIAIQALTGMYPRQLQEDEQGEWAWQDCVVVNNELAAVLAKMVRHQHTQRHQSTSEALTAIRSVKQALAEEGDQPFSEASSQPRRPISETDSIAPPEEDSTEVTFPFVS